MTGLLFKPLEPSALAHRDEDIAGFQPQVGRRIELHDATVMLHGEHDDSVFPAQVQLLQRMKIQKAGSANV